MRDNHAEQAGCLEKLSNKSRRGVENAKAAVASSKGRAAEIATQIERLKRGAAIAANLEKLTRKEMLARIGWREADARHAMSLNEIH